MAADGHALPTAAQIDSASLELAATGVIPERYWFLGWLWVVFGTAATVLPLINLYWMVFKPA